MENDLYMASFEETLDALLQKSKARKQTADDGETARHWAVVYTDLEKVKAYIQTYLEEE